MVAVFKQLESFLVQLFQSLASLLRVIVFSKFALKKPGFAWDEILIIGNGPSASQTLEENKNWIQQKVCLSVNFFALSEAYMQVKPKVYMLLDQGFLDLNYFTVRPFFEKIYQDTDWEMLLYIPIHFKRKHEWLTRLEDHPHIKLAYFNYSLIEGYPWFNHLMYGSGLGMMPAGNILICAIFQSIYLGVKKIYITGADHSWHEQLRVSDEDNALFLNDQHFYGEKNRNISAEFKSNETGISSELAKQFLSFHKVFKGHEKLALWAKVKNVEIINVSGHSNIDVYQRGSLPKA